MVGPAPMISPKRPLLVPKTGVAAPKSVSPATTPKALMLPKKATVVPTKATVVPKKAPLTIPKVGFKAASKAPPLVAAASATDVVGDEPSTPSQVGVVVSPGGEFGRHTSGVVPSLGSQPTQGLMQSMEYNDKDGVNEVDIGMCASRMSRHESIINAAEDVHSRGGETRDHGSANEGTVDAVGATPWLEIERRINEIRALATGNACDVSGKSPRTKKGNTSLYGNYNTHYESAGDWGKEVSNPLSYGMARRLAEAKHASGERFAERGLERWNFVDGFLKPRRKPFASMSELSRHFSHIQPHDQSELIKLLLACRSLEKVIEEQHQVLDMLDHDLREAREVLKLPEHLRGMSPQKLLGRAPQEQPFYPTSDIPLFIKGRVSLLPGSNDVQLSVVTKD
ncbi:uncharacterized protein BcabD6B2_19570 [Babesia caballi]|uniref:Uncharacterized protein n=1 Tax=Babesia caballi TaxID=5871 RepID=A0AAV4LRV9_BABCB|nr:hypothetical protein, conserved [Babesia caballi]